MIENQIVQAAGRAEALISTLLDQHKYMLEHQRTWSADNVLKTHYYGLRNAVEHYVQRGLEAEEAR